ncbi:MAG TPA: flavodoxin-dependent (E)-4-hydroxy-3-methylbut-2-enyl-diphosphate synthase [Oscillospiraceae bacterium]|nr:flavodoxin-dependent (E)-4-hydroxy-3-methylbut-2-enyl-diphosphate synthase [Oscillospiraceae bacterium]HPF56367.1 flavodoxin-dependent (E)-4-hydroxy-3-methylbut-2-enyl-diphosphate synthase [Clostridiales bacterium]HPK34284.1 flavodoxin-dependent (E)-4-hydroxy-3-methylbut-2-enyl-diphosphate synthase [Oscillospiraceae bacterium]HPR74813.1 flavodoxin-dependent (E)-4-hydroxy-3-methylbut-2-enyl-diphosphate synthase [Oscillospiraceae bacterium]
MRRICKTIKIGNIAIGGNEKIAVQSMLNARYDDIEGNIAQVKRLAEVGCDIIRIAVPNMEAIKTLAAVKEACALPLVADIHFDYKLAIESVVAGADKIRINPGNIGSDERVKAVADCCRAKNIPIRIGVNSGSLGKDMLSKYGGPTPQALAQSALYNAKLLERYNFDNIVISVKSSDAKTTVEANRILSQSCPYPLHLGVTEAGTEEMSALKSAAAIGSLLLDGIGDTIRISITGTLECEVIVGQNLLASLGMSNRPTVISCPTCGRTRGPVVEFAEKLQNYCADIYHPVKVAVMGCEVNGPGEAKSADIGMAFGNDYAILFQNGEIVKKGSHDEIYNEIIKYLEEIKFEK